MDEPASALDPIATTKIEELIYELKSNYTIVIVTHNMQQAARVSDRTAFFMLGKLVEYGDTKTIFMNPKEKMTEDYVRRGLGDVAVAGCAAGLTAMTTDRTRAIRDRVTTCNDISTTTSKRSKTSCCAWARWSRTRCSSRSARCSSTTSQIAEQVIANDDRIDRWKCRSTSA